MHENSNTILESSFDDARFSLAKNLSLLSTILMLTIGILYFIEGDFNAYLITAGGLVSLSAYIITIKTLKYRLPVIICLAILTFINIINLGVASHFHHIGDFFWIICIVTAAYFLLNRFWGILFLTINFISLFIMFYLVKHGHFIQITKPYTSFSQVNFFINLCLGSTLYSFLIIEFLKVNRDVARKYIRANKELNESNDEKTVMLTEIHHRVKNNLQIVTSLLRIQASDITDKHIVSEFSEAIDRISAIAKIHDKMYNKTLNQINLFEYLDDLIRGLIESYSIRVKLTSEINTNINSIPPKDLVPIALIFNELVTNSIKHAFKEKHSGKIKIDAYIKKNKEVTLRYSDDGKWLKPEKLSSSIGVELIDSFVDQLDGTYTTNHDNGTTYIIKFILND